MTRRRRATYPLAAAQDAVRRGSYWITRTASQGAMSLHLDESDIRECVLGLAIYVKVQMSPAGEAVIVSFKRDGGT